MDLAVVLRTENRKSCLPLPLAGQILQKSKNPKILKCMEKKTIKGVGSGLLLSIRKAAYQ